MMILCAAAAGPLASRKRIVRLMSEEKLRFVRTTQSKHGKPVAKNVIDRL